MEREVLPTVKRFCVKLASKSGVVSVQGVRGVYTSFPWHVQCRNKTRKAYLHDRPPLRVGASIKGIIHKLQMTHVDESRLVCIRSKYSNSKRVIARCHGLSRIMQLALNQRPHYIIEVISERFDKLSKEEQIKVLIHELMHIPHSFGGGFRAHKPYVTQKKVERMYRKFVRAG